MDEELEQEIRDAFEEMELDGLDVAGDGAATPDVGEHARQLLSIRLKDGDVALVRRSDVVGVVARRCFDDAMQPAWSIRVVVGDGRVEYALHEHQDRAEAVRCAAFAAHYALID